MTGLVLVGDAPIPGGAPGVGPGREPPPSLPGDEIRVPQDAPTIQAAVDAAEPGGLVLIAPGVYEEAVVVTTPFLTIRGLDRNEVILEGGFTLDNGISGVRGRRRDDREHDRAALPVERVPVVERVRVPRART